MKADAAVLVRAHEAPMQERTMAFRTSFQPRKDEQRRKPRDISQRTAILVAALIGLLSLWIRAGVPLVAAPIAFHDDAFFARTAHYLLAGHWLGPYDKMTLAKGMFYSLFVAGAAFLAIPLKVAEQLAYLAASAVTAFVAWRASGRRGFSTLIFSALALNPVMWHNWMARVNRESLYCAESLFLFALIMLVSFPELRRSQKNIRLGLICGVVWAAFWLTREESIWLLPACVVVVAAGVLNIWLQARQAGRSSTRNVGFLPGLSSITVPLCVSFVVFLLCTGGVAAINWHYYGVFRTNEFRSGGFVKAYGAFARIQQSQFHRYVPVPADARQKAYAVSPSAMQLASSLDGQHGHDWAAFGCSHHPIQPPCDLQGGWFQWALRDAAEESGHYRSATDVDAFYRAVANEINSACDSAKIQCSARRDTFTPPFRWEYVGETMQAAKDIGNLVFDMGKGEVSSVPSPGSAQGLANFASLTDEYISPPAGGVGQNIPLGRVDGWVAASEDVPTLEVVSNSKREVQSSITLLPAIDVSRVHPKLKSTRFSLLSECPRTECDLKIHLKTADTLVPFEKLVRGAPVDTPALILFIDLASGDEEKWTIAEHRRSIQMRIAHSVGMYYARSSRLLAVLATLGMLVAIVRYRVHPPSLPLLALASGSMVAVACRILVLSYIAATSFTTDYVHYCSPATSFLIVLVISGIYLGWSSFWRTASPEASKCDL